MSFTTCTIPGYLLLLGDWGDVKPWMMIAAIAATAVALVGPALCALRPAAQRADDGLGVGVTVS
jgi:hypothetical protein